MGIFNRSKLKVKSECIDNNISYYIDYHNFKTSEVFMSTLLTEMSQGDNYLVVIDTKMISKIKENTNELISKLIATLESLNLEYKVLKVARENRTTLFGATINTSDKKKSMDTIIGAMVDIENIKAIKGVLNDYFIYYYGQCSMEYDINEILDSFEKNYHNDSLKEFFNYNILDSNFLKQLVINTKKENGEFVLGIIENLNN